MKRFRTCLLVLLSITLPVQAVLAAALGGCLMHVQGGPGVHAVSVPATATLTATGHAAIANSGAHAASGAPGNSGCPHHRAAPSTGDTAVQAAADTATAEHARGPGDAPGAADLPADTTAEAGSSADPQTSAAPTADCSNCNGCCPGSAPPSATARWQGPQEQHSTLQPTMRAHRSLPVGTLERPPRASTPLFFRA